MVEISLRIDPVRGELALYGGEKTAHEPFPPWPQFAERTLTSVLEPLRSGRVSYLSGARGKEFEARWASWIGAAHAVSCSSGTAALHTALLALGIQPGDEVIVPSHTFLSTSLAVLHAGAAPVFCDVAGDHTMDPHALEALVTDRTRAVIVVHLYGIVCAMDRILEVAKRRGLAVVEDCAQSVGGEFHGRKAGTLGDAGCFSFSEGKHVSTGGEGGMVVTDDEKLAQASRSLRDYGREQENAAEYHGEENATEYRGGAAHVRVGFNYRLTEIQSIIGLGELDRLDTWNLPRRRIRENIRSCLLPALRRTGAPSQYSGASKRILEVPPAARPGKAHLRSGGVPPRARCRRASRLRRPMARILPGARLCGARTGALRRRGGPAGDDRGARSASLVGTRPRGAVRLCGEEGPARLPQVRAGQPWVGQAWGISPGGSALSAHPQKLDKVLPVELFAFFQHVERHLVRFFDRLPVNISEVLPRRGAASRENSRM